MKTITESCKVVIKSIFLCCSAILFLSFFTGCLSTDQLINTGLGHYEIGAYGVAIHRLLRGVNELEQSNPKDSRLPRALAALGVMAANDKEYAKSEEFFRRALGKAESLFPADNIILRDTIVTIGFSYLNRDINDKAKIFFERAAGITEKNSSFSKEMYAVDLDNLAVAHCRAGNYEEADKFSLKALGILDGLPSSREIVRHKGIVVSNLAYSYQKQNRFDEAGIHYVLALEMLDPAGKTQIGEAWRIKDLRKVYASFLRQQNRNEEANQIEQGKVQGR